MTLAEAASGPTWDDYQQVRVSAEASGQTGQWWCDNHFGNSIGGSWECVEGTNSSCNATAPLNSVVQCGRLSADGSTSYDPYLRPQSPFGYGQVQRVFVTQAASGATGKWWCDAHFGGNLGGNWKCRSVSGGNSCNSDVPSGEFVSCSLYESVQGMQAYSESPGQTGQWWCNNHFGKNLGGSWDCMSVSGGSCGSTARLNSTVTCGRYTNVDEAPFAPQACSDPNLDDEEGPFCQQTEYMQTRTASTLYLYNDYVRAGLNRSFGGTLFELYGTDKMNRIEQHGGGAVQLSVWGDDINTYGGEGAFFTTTVCNPTPFFDPEVCRSSNNGASCREFAARGAQISNCTTEYSCLKWTAGGPWNPIQAQAVNCGWNGDTNDVHQIVAGEDSLTMTLDNPYQFTKSTSIPGMIFRQTTELPNGAPYLKMTYGVENNSLSDMGEHNQEIPAIFMNKHIPYWYYFYQGPNPYNDVNGSVTRLRHDFGVGLNLSGRSEPYPVPESTISRPATEDWLTICDKNEGRCLTIASFDPEVKMFMMEGKINRPQYVTALGRFTLRKGYSGNYIVYLFPYRFDDVVGGKSIREWIYQLRGNKPTPTLVLSANPVNVTAGQSSTLSWSSTDATTCTASNDWSGARATSGNQSVSPAATASYVLSCSGGGGSATQSVTVHVSPANQPPTVNITNPSNGSTIKGVVNIQASASEGSGGAIASVSFKLDNGTPVVDTTYPYRVNWNTTYSAAGSHTLSAIAKDAAGNTSAPHVVTVTVNNTTVDTVSPQVSITSPSNSSTVKGTVSIQASASDNVGVSSVSFKLDNGIPVVDTTAPYQVNWNTTYSTSGNHTLTAIAKDAAGNQSIASTITVTVNNSTTNTGDTTLPTVTFTNPANNSTVSGTISIQAQASDNSGSIASVSFKLDNGNPVVDTTAPYQVNWNTNYSASGTHTLTATAKDPSGNQRSTTITVKK